MDDLLWLFHKSAAGLFDGKEVPDWLRNAPAIEKSRGKKVFPLFGLKNFRTEADLPVEGREIALRSVFIRDLLTAIRTAISNARDSVRLRISNSNQEDKPGKESAEEFVIQLSIFTENLSYQAGAVVRGTDGKVAIVCPSELIVLGKTVVLRGEYLFRAYQKIQKALDQVCSIYGIQPVMMPLLDSLPQMKVFSQRNAPVSGDLQIVFSATGNGGAWDLATMSERGISSCQSWDGDPQFSQCLIGSVASKYVGIIYLTSGKDVNGKGERMVKRCIVRFGVDQAAKNTPVILLGKMYDAHNPAVAAAFIHEITSRTSLKVIDLSNEDSVLGPENVAIPRENHIPFEERSYQDAKIRYVSQPDKKLQEGKVLLETRKSNRIALDATYGEVTFLLRRLLGMDSEQARDLAGPAFMQVTNSSAMRRSREFVLRLFLSKALKFSDDPQYQRGIDSMLKSLEESSPKSPPAPLP